MTEQRRPAVWNELATQERCDFERRWRFFAGIWLVYLIDPLSSLWRQHDAVPRQVLGVVLIAVFALAYVVLVPRGAFDGPRRARVGALVAMVGAAGVYLTACGSGGAGVAFAPYLAVAFVMLLPWLAAVPLSVGLCVAVTVLPQYAPGWDAHGLQWGVGAGTLFAAIVVGAMRLFAGTSNQLHRAQEEIEQLAAEQERLRIARDLHDLLGHALTTVTLKAELASRLVVRDPERAAAEMAEVAELGRQSLADVRATVTGYREVSLVGELATAREVLQAAGIEAELPAAAEDVPGDLRELFGWAVREGVTNAVRHSRAHHVTVRLDGRTIEVINDGVDGAGNGAGNEAGDGVGNGLLGLRERAVALGGRVRAGPDGTSGYRLLVEVPA